jgi:hypothetical protein
VSDEAPITAAPSRALTGMAPANSPARSTPSLATDVYQSEKAPAVTATAM